MKVKNLVFILIMTILILIVGASDVKAEYKTIFYEETPGDWYVGKSLNFTTSQWYTSYNIFCTLAGASTPTNIKVTHRLDTKNGKDLVWVNNNNKLTDEQTVKLLYIYSTLNDEIAKGSIASRKNNWETPQQHAVWTILGQTCSHQSGKNYAEAHKDEINEMLANAEAYYQFWKEDGENYETAIDLTNTKYANHKIGPFKVDYKEVTADVAGKTGKYGEIIKIELLKKEADGTISNSVVCYDSSNGTIGKLDKIPKPNEEIYINGIDNIDTYNFIKVEFNNAYTKDSYLVMGTSKNGGQQSSMFGQALRYTTFKEAELKLSDTFKFKILKTDATTNEKLSNVKFLVGYNDATISTHVTDSNGEVTIPVSVVAGKQEVIVNLHEVTPEGYKALDYAIQLTFNKENDEWICKKVAKITNGSENIEIIYDDGENFKEAELVTFNKETGILYLKNQRDGEIEFEIKKIDQETGDILPEVGFKYAAYYIEENRLRTIDLTGKTTVNSEKPEQELGWNKFTTTANTTKIKIRPPEGKNEIFVVIKETEPLEDYKGLSAYVVLKFTYHGDIWEQDENFGIKDGVHAAIWSSTENRILFVEEENNISEETISQLREEIKNFVEYKNDVLIIGNEPKDKDKIRINLYKVDGNNMSKNLSGAEFSVSVKNGEANKTSITIKNPTTITITPEDKEKEVVLTLEEENAPTGYKELTNSIKITYEYDEDKEKWKMTGKSGGNSQVTERIIRIKNYKKTPDPDPDPDPDPSPSPDPSPDPNPVGEDNLEGYVYLDGYSGNKIVSEPNGKRDNNEQGVKGVIVTLSDGRQTVTNNSGYYKFTNLDKDENYTITFEYDGVNYQATTSGPGSEPKETNRNNFNSKFATINYASTGSGIGLSYFAYGDEENWNPTYNNKPGWLLKTLDRSLIVSNDNFKTGAEASFETSSADEEEAVTHYMDFGLVKREVDLSLVNDVKEVKVSINGKETTYVYEGIPITGNTINIGNVSSDSTKSYVLELDEKDYLFGTTHNYTEQELKEYSETNKLKINATYKVVLNNQSNSNAKVNNIAYYYDTNYKFTGVSKGTASSTISQVAIDGKTYNKVDITNLNLELPAGEQKIVEVYLEIEGAGDEIKQETYKTIAEITSYTTTEGKVDLDSAPGNVVQGNALVYEDDTDSAPGLTLTASGTRTLSGYVWNDTKKENAKYVFADGVREEGEHGIQDVIVQLIEIKEVNGTKHYYLWDEQTSKNDGTYTFTNFIPGNYIVRFIYGKGTTENVKLYNGQDYKSTTDNYYDEYKAGKWYNEYHNGAENKSVARDNEARRLEVTKNTTVIDTNIGTALKNKTDGDSWNYIENTYMIADTSKINIAVTSEDGTEIENSNIVDGKTGNYYNFKEVNFGLEERPKTAIEMEKHVTGLRITANDGTTILDAEFLKVEGKTVTFTPNSIIKGLQAFYSTRENQGNWQVAADIEETIQGATLELVYTYTVRNVGETDYTSKLLAQAFENNKVGYKDTLEAAKTDIQDIIKEKDYNSVLGKYLGTTYYTGKVADDVTQVKTYVGKIEDYINNDLKFTAVNSSDFIVNEPESSKERKIYKPSKETGLWSETTETINTVVISKNDIGYMLPEEARIQTITLESNGKLTSTGTLDFPGYIAQIKTEYENPVGRRDTKSIPGNLTFIDNYTLTDNEPDEYWTESIRITKPTGEDRQTAVTIAASIAAGLVILVTGIHSVKKYLL